MRQDKALSLTLSAASYTLLMSVFKIKIQHVYKALPGIELVSFPRDTHRMKTLITIVLPENTRPVPNSIWSEENMSRACFMH